MKFCLTTALAALTLTAAVAPASAFDLTGPAGVAVGASHDWTTGDTVVERRKPRIPGGSGCDSPRDLREHPECRV